jgi:hypothetical protein
MPSQTAPFSDEPRQLEKGKMWLSNQARRRKKSSSGIRRLRPLVREWILLVYLVNVLADEIYDLRRRL